jgi:biopolymer transport protein ExbD
VKLTRNLQFNPALLQVLPLVNVLFLVLMLFAMSSRFVLQPGIGVALPFSPFTLEPQRHPQVVSVTAAPAPAIYYLDRQVPLAELDRQLGAGPVEKRSLIIKADRSTPYELVMEVMNLGLKHGFSVVLAGNPARK